MLNVSLLFGDWLINMDEWVDSLHLGRGVKWLGKMGCGRISLLER